MFTTRSSITVFQQSIGNKSIFSTIACVPIKYKMKIDGKTEIMIDLMPKMLNLENNKHLHLGDDTLDFNVF